MNAVQVGRHVRAIRLRNGLRQQDVARRANVSRGAVSLLERGHAARLSIGSVESVLAALGARFEPRISWRGTDLDRLLDAGHAALGADVKARLTRWGWTVRAEVSFNHFGERGRIDLLAWHPVTATVLVIELKTDLVDVQQLLGSMDVKARIARRLWPDRRVGAGRAGHHLPGGPNHAPASRAGRDPLRSICGARPGCGHVGAPARSTRSFRASLVRLPANCTRGSH